MSLTWSYNHSNECLVYKGNAFSIDVPYRSQSCLVMLLREELFHIFFMEDGDTHIVDKDYRLLEGEQKDNILFNLTPLKQALLTQNHSQDAIDNIYHSSLYKHIQELEQVDTVNVSEYIEEISFLSSDLFYRYDLRQQTNLNNPQTRTA